MYTNNDINYMKWLENKKIIIFCAGKRGKILYKKLKKNNFNIIAFCDNNTDIQGTFFDGIRIMGIDECEKIEDDFIYIISAFYEDVKLQLLQDSCHHFITFDQIDFSYNKSEYYDETYFEYQNSIGKVLCKMDIGNFEGYIRENDTVVEFGSGGGYLLNLIHAKEKVGIEINKYAIENSNKLGIKTVQNVNQLPDNYADVIISTHALEHVDNPLDIIKGLREKLKETGIIICIVPFQGSNYDYVKDDINNHLYNWNCVTLGNLFKRAGYFVRKVECILNQYPPEYSEILECSGTEMLKSIGRLYSEYSESKSIVIVASR